MSFNNEYIHRHELYYFIDSDSDDPDLDDEEDYDAVLNYEVRPMQHGHNVFRQEFIQRNFS